MKHDKNFLALKETAYGGVVINRERKLLLKEPKGHFDGYIDRPLEGLTPEDIVQNIELLSFAADNLDNQLANEFGAKLFS